MNVVDHQDVQIAESVAEVGHEANLNSIHELGDKAIARCVVDVGVGFGFVDAKADCLEEVGFAEADTAVDKQGVVRAAGLRTNCQRRGMSEAISGTLDKALEGVIGVDDQAAIADDFAMRLRFGFDLNNWNINGADGRLNIDLRKHGALRRRDTLPVERIDRRAYYRLWFSFWRLGEEDVVLRTQESNGEQAAGDSLGGFAELLCTGAAEVVAVDVRRGAQLQGACGDTQRFEIVKPLPADASLVLAQVRENEIPEVSVIINHDGHNPARSRRRDRDGGLSFGSPPETSHGSTRKCGLHNPPVTGAQKYLLLVFLSTARNDELKREIKTV